LQANYLALAATTDAATTADSTEATLFTSLKTTYDVKVRQTLYKSTMTEVCQLVYTADACVTGDHLKDK